MKRIVIISQYIAPTQEIASIRWTKIAKYLKMNHDVEITILTTCKSEKEVKDPLLVKDMKYFDEYVTIKENLLFCTLKRFRDKIRLKRRKRTLQNNSVEMIYNNEGERQFKDATLKHRFNTWLDEKAMESLAKRASKKYQKEIKNTDVLISTYGPIWDHMAAEKIKEKNQEILWIADFRDIYAGNEYETKDEFEKHKDFTKLHLKNAKYLTRVTPGIKLYETSAHQVIEVSNGYDPAEKKEPIEYEKFMLLYTGTMYPGTSDLSPVFKAVVELLDEGKIKESDVEIVYAGKSKEVFEHQTQTSKATNISKNLGVVSRDKVLELQQKASVLLQSSFYSKEFKYMWTGKMFEYMLAEKPIILASVGEEPSEPCSLMYKLGGVGYEPCDHENAYMKMKDYICDKYNEWKTNKMVSINRDEEYVKMFSYDSIANQIWNLIEQG